MSISQSRVRFAIVLMAVVSFSSSGGSSSAGASSGVAFPLRASADGRRLEDQNGVPFLLHGDSAWNAEVRLTTSQIEAYLDDRRQRGFNTILVEAIEHRFNGGCTVDVDCWNNQNGDAPFTTMNPDVAFDSPNEAYWSQLDSLLDAARDRDMLVLLAPAYIGAYCTADGWAYRMVDDADDAEMRAYGEFLGARYASQGNLLWVLGGDSHPDDYGCPDGLIDRINAVEAGIAVHDPVQLRTALDRRGYSASDRYGAESWLDIGNTFSGCYSEIGEPYFYAYSSAFAIQEDYETATAPFFYIEGRYENEVADLQCLISQAWWSLLGGEAGHVFGNNPIWFFGPGWEAELGSPGSVAMEVLHDMMSQRPWFELVPDYAETIVTEGRGDNRFPAYVAAASTPDGELLMVYVPEAGEITVDLSKLAGAEVDVWRFDATNGSSVLDGSYPTSGPQVFASTGLEVLVFQNALRVPALGDAGAALLALLMIAGALRRKALGSVA